MWFYLIRDVEQTYLDLSGVDLFDMGFRTDLSGVVLFDMGCGRI